VLREEMFDVILLESLFTTSYIPAIRRLSDAEVVLRAHNVEHHLWEEVTESMATGPKKWLLSLFQAKLRDEELRLLGAVDAVAAITEKDAAWFREAMTSQEVGDPERVVALPFGLDVDHTPHAAIQTAPERILHLGAMDWTPNQQGVMWLLEHVWPLVRERHADAELDLAGRHMPEELASIPEQGVNVLGEVADAASTYDTACAVVVPLHAGSGMRIKLAEALAAGRPVVTTSKGMEGLDLEHGVHVLVADTAEAMSDALVRVLTDADLALQLGRSGRQWALENMGHRARAKTLTQHLSQWVRA
jgi:glycosyltransferase involved in cell wall biosynthesis